MIEFNEIWQLLVNNGASLRKEEGTRRYWLTLTPEQQQLAFTNISRKLSEGAFVHYDPIRAIKENIWQAKKAEPTFMRGDEPVELVQVLYNGMYKICTPETAKAFGLQIIRTWKH